MKRDYIRLPNLVIYHLVEYVIFAHQGLVVKYANLEDVEVFDLRSMQLNENIE